MRPPDGRRTFRAVARRILLLVTDLQIGGTPTVVRELARRLNDPPSVNVEVACLSPSGPVADQLVSMGVDVFPLGAKHATDLLVVGRLLRLIHSRQYDTVFSFLVHANAVAALVRPFAPSVRFLQSIQTTQPNPRWHWAVQSIAQTAAERAVVPSPSAERVAVERANVPTEKIVVIPNAIDPAAFNGSSAGLESRFARRPVPVGFIGRLDPVKRIPTLIEAVRQLNGLINLEIFGEGGERKYLQSLAATLPVPERVHFHGAIDGPAEALRKTALLALPSAAEGFGLVLIEAMAAGIPVVATDVPGIRDVVRNGQTGLLSPPGSPEQLAANIRRLIEDGALRDRLIASARQDVLERFTWVQVLPQYRALLDLPPASGR